MIALVNSLFIFSISLLMATFLEMSLSPEHPCIWLFYFSAKKNQKFLCFLFLIFVQNSPPILYCICKKNFEYFRHLFHDFWNRMPGLLVTKSKYLPFFGLRCAMEDWKYCNYTTHVKRKAALSNWFLSVCLFIHPSYQFIIEEQLICLNWMLHFEH